MIYLLLLYLQSLPTVRHWQTSWGIKFKKSVWIKALHQAKTENCSLSVYQHKPSLSIWQKSVLLLATSALTSEVVLFVLSSLTGVILTTSMSGLFQHSHGKAQHSHLDLLTLFGVCILAILQWFKHGSTNYIYNVLMFWVSQVLYNVYFALMPVLWFINSLIFWFASIML